MKKIVFKRASDGGIVIVNPSPTFLAKFDTEAEGMAAVQAKAVHSDATEIEIIDESEVPTDRTFRAAWARIGGAFAIDMAKASETHAAHIAGAQTAEIARLNKEERLATLAGRTADAAQHASDRSVIEGEDQGALAVRISNAPNATALSAVWPQKVPR